MRPVYIALALVLVAGCQRYGGSSLASYANPDQQTTTAVVTQRDPQGSLLFLVAWTTKNGAGRTSSAQPNLVTEIHGHPIHPNLERHAVYALQPDNSLKEIPLTPEQATALFQEMQSTDFHTSHSKLWQSEVAPRLLRVEAPNGS
jgi:hypothetical protein